MKKDKQELVSIIIPSYNEKDNIKKTILKVVRHLTNVKINYEILVVDDKSKDGSIEIIRELCRNNKRIKLIIREKNPGFGYSLVDGSKASAGEIIIWLMADASDDLNTISAMIKKIEQGYDMIIGSRNVAGGSRGDQNKLKAFGSRQFSRLAKILFELPIYDITNAFRAFRKEIINKIRLENSGFAISPEFAIKAHLKGYRLAEVPTTYSERKEGKAKTRLFRMGIFYYYLLFKYWLTLRKNSK